MVGAPRSSRTRAGLWATLGVLVVLACGVAGAEPISSIPNPRVRDGTWVTDVPRALRPDTVAKLNALISDMEKKTTVEAAVVVVGSLDGMSIEEYAVKLFELWGIGKADGDNGLLLIWSTGDRRVRVEVGYGLEGDLPDGKVGVILDTYVIPRFKAGQFDEGVLAGVEALARVVGHQPVALPSPRSEAYEQERDWTGGGWIWRLLGAIPLGIGSLVGFRRWRRNRRRRCPQCRTRMHRLTEAEDDARLDEGQRAEERVRSVDYDVWVCPACAHHFTLRYPRWVTGYDKCPQCHNRTKSSKETVLERATSHGEGKARVVEQCAFCTYTVEHVKVLPRIESSSGSSSGGGSSFGGGSSGGGGASRGY